MKRLPKKFRFVGRCLLAGVCTTLAIAWTCSLWSPITRAFDPFENRSAAVEFDPQQATFLRFSPEAPAGLYAEASGVGWTAMDYVGARGRRADGREDYSWAGPYGGEYYQFSGWPFSTMTSCVTVWNSQGNNRGSDSNPPGDYIPQPRRWELPAGEIIHRGLASKDLPAWLHAQPDRRIPLVPLPLGFSLSVLMFSVAYGLGAKAVAVHFRPTSPTRSTGN